MEDMRYLGLAIAGADVFFELDANNQIVFLGGATGWLGEGNRNRLKDRAFLSVVSPASMAAVARAIETARTVGRTGAIPLKLSLGTSPRRDVIFSASLLPEQPGALYIAIKAAPKDMPPPERATQTPLEQLAATAASQPGDQSAVTLVNVDGLEVWLAAQSPASRAVAAAALASAFAGLSASGEEPVALGSGRYGFITDQIVPAEVLAEAARGATGQAFQVSSASLALDIAADDEDFGRTLVYAITQFTETGTLSIRSFSECYDRMMSDARDRLTEFKAVVAERRFDIVLQPIVGLTDGRIHHYEALTRLQDAKAGASPYKFITFAEEMGVIPEFDLSMCRRVVEKIEQVRASGGHLSVAVNLSGRSLSDPAFVEQLLTLVKDAVQLKDQLMFEVTESTKIKDLDTANRVLASLRAQGFPVCLDDFGAGAAGFQYLRALDVDYVKIDGAYVLDALVSARGRIFLKSMTGLAHDLGIATIGECVETEAHASHLRALSVAYGQGYLFGKPVAGVTGRSQSFAQARSLG